jgi:hypothetical protein
MRKEKGPHCNCGTFSTAQTQEKCVMCSHVNVKNCETFLLGGDFNIIPEDIDVPNAVTAILASYRGYDTLGETAVVFTAGIGVLMLISGLRRRRRTGVTEKDVDDTKETT